MPSQEKGGVVEYTRRRNVNRGYMKLEVWIEALDLFGYVHSRLGGIDRIDFRLKGQLLDSTQSISANIAEGCCRRTLNEYLQYLNIALGSCGESMTRMIGLEKTGYITREEFEEFDKSQYSHENKLVALIKSLQAKRRGGTWEDEFREGTGDYTP